jgi:hypothetical protein
MTNKYFSPFIRVAAFSILISFFPGNLATAATACPAEAAEALADAQESLKANDPEQDRRALECLTNAVAALSAEVAQMRDGSVPMSGVFRHWSPKAGTFRPAEGAQP